jgi:putative ABC transport system ATP-binding protein
MVADRLSAPLLELAGASRRYGSGPTSVLALDGVDLAVGRGEQVAIIGPSGAGKSTLLALLGLLDRPTEGAVRLDGVDVGALGDDARADLRRERIGLVFQLFHLVPGLSALENVILPLVPYRARREIEADGRELLGALGLGDRLRHRPGELSGGEQQRVAIARSLIARPDLVLADEPTGNLDSQTSRQVVELLAALQAERGFALVVATHDAAIAERFPRHVNVRDGRIDQ